MPHTRGGLPDGQTILDGRPGIRTIAISPAVRLAVAGILIAAVGDPSATLAAEPHTYHCESTRVGDAWRQAADRDLFIAFRPTCLGAGDIYPDDYQGRYVLAPTAVAVEPAWNEARVTGCVKVAADVLRQCDVAITDVALLIVAVPEPFRSLDLVELNAMAHGTPDRSRHTLHTYFVDRFATGDAISSAIAPAAGDVAGATTWITTDTARRPHTDAGSRRLHKRLQRMGFSDADPAALASAMDDVKCGMSLAHEYAHVLRNDHIVVTRAGHDDRGHTDARGNVMTQGQPADTYLRGKYRFSGAQCRDITETGVSEGLLRDQAQP